MQKKRLPSKVLSVVLSLLMMLTVIPLVPGVTADAAATEYYHPAGQKYIKDLAIIYYKSASEGQGVIKSTVGHDAGTGYALLKDLTAGTGGDYYVYLGWTWTTNPNEAVRGFRIEHNGSVASSYYQSGVYWYPINSGVHSWVPQLHSDGCVDLNRGKSNSDDIKLYLTKDPAFGPPVTFLDRAGSTGERDSLLQSGYTGVVTFSDNSYIIDVNKGAGGDDLFLLYKRDTSVTTVNTSSLRSVYNNTAVFDGAAGYTPASAAALSSARNQAKTIMDAFDSNNGYASYSQAAINNAVNQMNNAANNLKTNLYLDASTNGGSPDQTVEVLVGRNKTATVDLSKYTATKSGADFAGWSKSSLSTTGTTGTVTVGFNETYYALFGKALTANFHYLASDGTLKKDTQSVYAMNAATAAATPLPSARNVTVNGKTYTFLGWREDTQATTNTINKTGVYTIYETNPNVNVYAVYSTPITFTQDTNKGEPAIEPQVQTQYINANTEITKTSHEFIVSADEPVRDGGKFLGWADTTTATASQYKAGYKFTLTDDLTIYAAYKMNYVKVQFVDGNGIVIDEQSVAYGDDASFTTEVPTKDFDDENHYVFTGWDVNDLTALKADTIVTAQFDAIPHTIEDDIITEPYCESTGLKDQFCTGCDFIVEDIEIAALGHHKAFDPGTPATCTRDGETDLITCLRCNTVLQERETIPALRHNYVLSEAVTATCSKGGYEIWVCLNNENHKETRNETAPTGVHKEITVKGWAAECLVNGLTDGTECEQCGAVLSAQNIILADGHHLITDAYVAPTCEETGLTKGAHCENCDYVIAQEVIPETGHDWADFTAKAATCTEAGYTAGSKCRYCHEVKDSEEIPALNHGENGYEVITHEATCTEDGYTEYVCAYDEKHNYTVEGEKSEGHKGGTATCTEQAACDVCGEAYGKKANHDYAETVIPATCTKNGYTEYTCKVCGDTYQDNETATASHTYDNGRVTVEASCDTEGEKTFKCLYCEDSYTEAIPAKGHAVDNWVVEGTEAEGDCSDCGEHITANPEDVGLELPECERCGMVHRYNSGIFKYKGIYCSIVYFFRQVAAFFKGEL